MISIEIDTHKVSHLLGHLMDVTGADGRAVLQDGAKRLARTITAFMPPLSSGRKGSAKATGEAAVELQLKNLVSEATPNLIDEIGSKYGVTDIQTAYLTEQGGEKLNLQWEHLDPTGARLDEYHEQYRDREGRVAWADDGGKDIWKSRVVVPVGTRQPLIDRNKAKVGLGKAAWALTGSKLGDHYPSWISRQFGRVVKMSRFEQNFSDPKHPSITFGSSAPGVIRFKQDIAQAVRKRGKAIATRISTLIKLKAEGKPLPPNPEVVEVIS